MNKLYIGVFFLLLTLIAGLKIAPAENNIIKLKNLQEDGITFKDDLIIEKQSNIKFVKLGVMRSSWYGPRFHGRLTANGEVYDQMGFTAAHKSLPFGTLLKVTNPKNNKSIIVRINDRGPYIPGRQLDLSKKAAIELGTYQKGVVNLTVEKLILKGLDEPMID